MSDKTCLNCEEVVESYINFCDFDCHIAYTRKNGGKDLCPNGLPIRCIRFDGMMMEHEHADHCDYMFPVHVRYTGSEPEKVFTMHGPEGPVEMSPEWVESQCNETHALIYTDGNIAVTMSEYCYAFWSVTSGLCTGSHSTLWKPGEWKLSDESLQRVKESCAHKKDR